MLVASLTTANLRASCITDFSEGAISPADWNRIAGDVPFRRWEWLATWWRHYQRRSARPFIVTVHTDDGEMVGLAPWYIERSCLSGSVLRFLGAGEVCSENLTILAASGCEADVAHAVAHWLANDAAGQWDLIDLEGIVTSDPVLQGFFSTLQSLGHLIDRREQIGSWCIELSDTWEGYLARLAKRRREKVRQLLRKKFDTGRAVARTALSENEYVRAWQIFEDLHQKRRNSLGEAGCFASSAFGAFHAEVSRRFFDLGQLRMHWVELDGSAIAIEYGLTGGETVYYYQSGLDPAREAEQPGWLEVASSIKLAIEQGYRRFDFLRGDEPYKSHWRAERTGLFQVRVVAKHVTARLRHRLWSSGVAAKRRLKAWKQKLSQTGNTAAGVGDE
jgi:CelD/BcsL family acetyltransferase involved in cellulose biosynthesis